MVKGLELFASGGTNGAGEQSLAGERLWVCGLLVLTPGLISSVG